MPLLLDPASRAERWLRVLLLTPAMESFTMRSQLPMSPLEVWEPTALSQSTMQRVTSTMNPWYESAFPLQPLIAEIHSNR